MIKSREVERAQGEREIYIVFERGREREREG
jgi:hypothetical protein